MASCNVCRRKDSGGNGWSQLHDMMMTKLTIAVILMMRIAWVEYPVEWSEVKVEW